MTAPVTKMAASKVLVVGSGMMGLRTALELLRKNVSVVMRSARSPTHPSTCSMGAGGLWMPFHCDDPRVDRWAIETLDELHLMAYNSNASSSKSSSSSSSSSFQSEDDESTFHRRRRLVEIVGSIFLFQKHEGPVVKDFIAENYKDGQGGESPLPTWSADKRLEFQHLSIEMLAWQNSVFRLRLPPTETLKQAGYHHAWFFRPPIVDAPRMLDSLLTEVRNHEMAVDVDVNTGHEYESIDEMMDDGRKKGCDAVVNCTGLASAKVCNDAELLGARGALLHFDRNSAQRWNTTGKGVDGEEMELLHDACILSEQEPWGTEALPCYMIPRGDKLLVGGTYLEGDTRTTIASSERARLLENARLMGIDTTKSPPVGEWVGFRPHRPTTRCELDTSVDSDIKVVHNYGHGGSGWTVYVGAAKEVAKLLGLS